MYNLVKYPDPFLRVKCSIWDINNPTLAQPLVELKNAMESICIENKGVGLAACQIGVDKRVICIFADPNEFTFIINPEVLEVSGNKVLGQEGCLSVGSKSGYFNVPRYETVKYKGYTLDKDNNIIEVNQVLTGFQARVFQHEYDHIEGILYIDRVKKTDKPAIIKAFGIEPLEQKPQVIKDFKEYID